MSRGRFAIVVAVVWLAASGVLMASTVGLPAWDVVRTPSLGTIDDELFGVSALSSHEVWAVGARGDRTLTERWDGSAFSIVPSPSVLDRPTVLRDVSARAATDVWAVGHTEVSGLAGPRAFIVRWNGGRWVRLSAPNRGSIEDHNLLTGVVAISSSDAWAVGSFRTVDGSRAAALTLHWNGSAWRSVPNRCGQGLEDVFALSSTNVWAVGGGSTCRWDGQQWIRYPAAPGPNPGQSIDLQDVSGTGPSNVWAVGVLGSSCGEGQVCFSGVIERWNGTSWSFRSTGAVLNGVHALSATDVYAVGTGRGPTILHFDGTRWETVPEPTPLLAGSLFAVDSAGTRDLWAVGSRLADGTLRTLAERAPSPTSGAVVGQSAGNATVSWFGPESGSIEADQFGRYRVGGLDAGRYRFTATSPACVPRSKDVTVVAGTTIGVDLYPSC